MIHHLHTINDLLPLYAELREKNIGFYAFVSHPKMWDERKLGSIVCSSDYPDYYYDLGDMIFETDDDMRKKGIIRVSQLTMENTDTIYVGYNIHGLPIFYDMDLKQV